VRGRGGGAAGGDRVELALLGASERRSVTMMHYLEDLVPGERLVSVGRTVTEADIMAFAGVSGDFNQLHINEQWVRENTPFTGRIAHGLLVLSIASGLRTPGLDNLAVIAYLEETRRFVAPTYPGETIFAEWRIESTRASASRPGTGIVEMAVDVKKTSGETVQHGRDVLLVATRPSA
jgi:3-hydroxybutyryl-CoA dehydratase